MKLSQDTIAVLKNFSAIQPNLVVEPGSTISTLADAMHIMAEATIEETFHSKFGIYDLNEFLSAHSLLDDADLEFSESSVLLKSGAAEVNYHFADTTILTTKTKKVEMPPADISFVLTEQHIANIRRASAALKLDTPVLSIIVEDGKVVARVMCIVNPSSNSYSLIIGPHEGDPIESDFRFVIDNLKLISGDYEVDITNKLISNWKHKSKQVQYWIALDKTSKVG
jgi:hypothetical protein